MIGKGNIVRREQRSPERRHPSGDSGLQQSGVEESDEVQSISRLLRLLHGMGICCLVLLYWMHGNGVVGPCLVIRGKEQLTFQLTAWLGIERIKLQLSASIAYAHLKMSQMI
jgi:hypothetical protein